MFKSTAASFAEAKLFSSLGVQRFVEISINGFDDMKYFVTFKVEFIAALREYKESGYSRELSEIIFSKYGMFILERGIYGGYMQLTTVANEVELLDQISNEGDQLDCYEAAISAEASSYGFSTSSTSGSSQCEESSSDFMLSLRNNFLEEVVEIDVVGGTIETSDSGVQFRVTAETSTLLSKKEMYPSGDGGIKLRLLTDFLSTSKISPVEMRRHQITEVEFDEIQQELKTHLIATLQDVQQSLDECIPCDGLIYLEREDNSNMNCECYDPPNETMVPSSTFTVSPTISPSSTPSTSPFNTNF